MSSNIQRLLWSAAFLILIVYLSFTLWLGLSGLLYPYQLDYGEGIMLYQANLIHQGQNIYKGMYGYPYVYANYPPLSMALSALLIPVFGVSYVTGRLFVLAAVLGTAGLAALVIGRASGSGRAAVLAALFFLGSRYVYHWVPLFRNDLLALFFSVAGVYVVWRYPRSRLCFLSVLLFNLSLYTKQSYFAAPLAAWAYLFFVNRRLALELAALTVAVGGGLFLYLDARTGGGFAFGLIYSNVNPFYLDLLAAQAMDFLRTHPVLALLGLWYLWVKLTTGEPSLVKNPRAEAGAIGVIRKLDSDIQQFIQRKSLSTWDLYLVTGPLTMGLAGKVGAWENYFFEPLFVLSLASGLALARLEDMAAKRPALALALPALLLLQAAAMFHTPAVAARMMREDAQANRELAPIVASHEGMILSEDVGLLAVNGKEVPYFSFQYTQLAQTGRWDQSWELGQLRNRGFSQVILEKGTRENPDRYRRFTREVLSEIDRNYALAREIGKYQLYRPAPLWRELSIGFGQEVTLGGFDLEKDAGAGGELWQRARTFQGGDRLRLSILWQAQQTPLERYKAFVHVVDGEGKTWAQSDGEPMEGMYPTSRWAKGEMVRDRHTLSLPVEMPAGCYLVRVGLYRLDTGQRLGLASGGDELTLAGIQVGQAQVSRESIPSQVNANLSEQVSLLGYRIGSLQAKAGDQIQLILYWEARRFMSTDFTAFVHLVDSAGSLRAQVDRPPTGGAYPTSAWMEGEVVEDQLTLPLGSQLPPGEYRLLVGLYDPATLQRLAVIGDSGAKIDDKLFLTSVIVIP
ncbi:MAG: hypothetical protein AB1566_02930 [Chloroflexota bacterium]